jgi:enterochelin esterase-like enzyme
MDWFVNEFKPMIDARFPTLPDREHTFIAGSSMGGLMSLYALAEYNHVFSRAAALSPSVEFGPQKLDALLKNADFAPDTVLYMDMGETELRSRNAQSRWRSVCRLLLQKNVRLTARVVPGGEHNEASWEKQNPFFISTLLYGLED